MNLITATRLQELRKANGYSQEVLAEKLGVSRQSVSKWERAEASPDTDNLILLSKIYGVSIDDLLNTEKDKVIIQTKSEKPKDFKGKMRSLLSKANDFGIYPKVAKTLGIFPFPIIITIIYLALSMIFDIWHPLWIIFLTIPIYYRFAISCKANNKRVFALLQPIPELCITIFLLIGIFTDYWGYACFILMVIPLYYWCVIVIKPKKTLEV